MGKLVELASTGLAREPRVKAQQIAMDVFWN